MRSFFRWCVEEDYVVRSPLQDLSSPEPLEARDRVLSDSEVKLFWTATASDTLYGPFFRLLLLTGQRRNEVTYIQWPEIDLTACSWLIPRERTKNDKPHLVHLNPQAMAILDSKPEFIGKGINSFSRAKNNLDILMPGVLPWRIHDLRRTTATGMAANKVAPHIIERVLNHVSGTRGGLVAVYQRHEYLEERKRALEVWGAHVQGLVTDRPVAQPSVLLQS